MKMKKIVSGLLALTLITNTSAVFCQQPTKLDIPSTETPEGEVDPGLAISPMKLSQKAPFTGVLLAPKAIAFLVAKLNSFDKEKKLAVDEAVDLANEVCKNEKNNFQIQAAAQRSILEARVEDQNKVIKAYDDQLKKEKEQQTDPAMWALIGAAGGVAVTVLTTFAVSQAMK